VLETMLKQQVAIVGDSDDVLMLLEKQKVRSTCRFLFHPLLTRLLLFLVFCCTHAVKNLSPERWTVKKRGPRLILSSIRFR
jgi:hypothetical protein